MEWGGERGKEGGLLPLNERGLFSLSLPSVCQNLGLLPTFFSQIHRRRRGNAVALLFLPQIIYRLSFSHTGIPG